MAVDWPEQIYRELIAAECGRSLMCPMRAIAA
jgi:hypothetical protein